MIQSFADTTTQCVFEGKRIPKWQSFQLQATRKLNLLDAAIRLEDLRNPPGNRPESLSGDRQGQHSIRINAKWRVCFRWTTAGPADVQIFDYH
jgi:proteic killer suppression protein